MNSLAGQFRISLLAAGEAESRRRLFEEIWDNYQQRITIFVRYSIRCSREECEDITQEVFLRVYRSLHRYNPVYSFNGWIYTLARNCCTDHLRKITVRETARQNSGDLQASTGMMAAPDPEQEMICRQLCGNVAAFIRSLEPADRQMAFLRFYEGLSYKTIGKILDTPSGTVKYRIHVIRKRLVTSLEKTDEIRI